LLNTLVFLLRPFSPSPSFPLLRDPQQQNHSKPASNATPRIAPIATPAAAPLERPWDLDCTVAMEAEVVCGAAEAVMICVTTAPLTVIRCTEVLDGVKGVDDEFVLEATGTMVICSVAMDVCTTVTDNMAVVGDAATVFT